MWVTHKAASSPKSYSVATELHSQENWNGKVFYKLRAVNECGVAGLYSDPIWYKERKVVKDGVTSVFYDRNEYSSAGWKAITDK